MQNNRLYQRLRDLREDEDLTQAQIAKVLSMGTTQYRRYELAESPLSLEIAEKLAEFYDVSIDYIAGRTNDKKGLTRSELADEETELIKKYRYLSERQKGRIDQVMKEIEQEQEQECKRKEA